MELKILDTDRFFNDSPNAGELNCICSRCHKLIGEDEEPFRVAVDREIIYVKDANGKEIPKVIDAGEGYEFRLCKECIEKLKRQ